MSDPRKPPTQDEIDEMLLGPRECDEPEDDDMSECGLSPDGQCSLAGSEWCDFECAYRDSEFFAGSKAWNEAHKKRKKP